MRHLFFVTKERNIGFFCYAYWDYNDSKGEEIAKSLAEEYKMQVLAPQLTDKNPARKVDSIALNAALRGHI